MDRTPNSTATVSAIVAAYQRPDRTVQTVRWLQQCQPPPAEVLVHVDDNNGALAEQLRMTFPDIRVLFSNERLGPGGARNQLIRAASQELVASFDDDSYPLDSDFFKYVIDTAATWPDAAVYTATLLEGPGTSPFTAAPPRDVATFAGGACVFRKSVFLRTTGYVPLPLAYGMEEVDLSLRLHAMGERIVHVPELRVVHDVAPLKSVRRIEVRGLWPRIIIGQDPGHRDTPEISAGTIANLALLPFLRYPVVLWPYGAAQCLHKALELIINGRAVEALSGLGSIPSHLWRHRRHRGPLSMRQVLSYLKFRKGKGEAGSEIESGTVEF